MRLTPQEPQIPEIGGFTDENDIFGYRSFANRLANLVRNIDEPLVIALDGPWGSGKSIFVKQWAGLLRERGAPVIHFDAFGNDHYEDAFLALSAEIHATAKRTLGGSESTTRRYLNKAKKAGMVLAPIALRVASRAGTAGLLSLEDVEAGGEALKAVVKAAGNESAKAVEKVISERLRNASEERAALEAFRETLSDLAGTLAKQQAGEGGAFPLVFIVDELDRCRPPFALSIIERIKHLFSVPGVCFVLVTHLPQLEQAVQGAYGTTFDAHIYLEKFYNLRVTLPEDKDRRRTQCSTYAEYLWHALGISFSDARVGELVQRELQALAETYDLSLRRLERVMTHVALVCVAAGAHQLVIAPSSWPLCHAPSGSWALQESRSEGTELGGSAQISSAHRRGRGAGRMDFRMVEIRHRGRYVG
jgi:dephospho-CoA kinase